MVAGVIPLDYLAPRLAVAYAALEGAEGLVPLGIKATFGAFARIGRAASPRCFYCGDDEDDADHTLIVCREWTGERNALVRELGGMRLSLPGIVRASLNMPGGWAAFKAFARRVMRKKEQDERDRKWMSVRWMHAGSQRGFVPRRPPRARLWVA
ncbi:hypothetical protein M0804_003947 [Polistes exclamans]|nr:hypothetical protein M0804_003947 [Polistes exclamans]